LLFDSECVALEVCTGVMLFFLLRPYGTGEKVFVDDDAKPER